MITIEELQQYRDYKQEVKALEEEINHLYSPIQSPNTESIGTHGNTPSDPTARAVARIEKLSKNKEQLLTKIALIESYVDAMDNKEISSIIRMHYFIGFTWAVTSYKLLGYYAPDMLKKSVKRYLNGQIERNND